MDIRRGAGHLAEPLGCGCAQFTGLVWGQMLRQGSHRLPERGQTVFVARLGYDRRALLAQTLLAWVILPVCYGWTQPSDNINWVFGPGQQPQTWMSPRLYFLLVMLVVPLCVYVPTHLALQALMPPR